MGGYGFPNPLLLANGTAALFALGVGESTTGVFLKATGELGITTAGTGRVLINSAAIQLKSDMLLSWSQTVYDGFVGVCLNYGGVGILEQKNAAQAQEFRIYGTTTGPLYLSLKHDGSNALIDSAGVGSGMQFKIGGAAVWSIANAGGLSAAGNYRLAHGTSALAVGATEGFFHLQSAAGLPTGTPATIPSGQIPLVINTVTDQLNLYSAAAWKALPRTLDVNVTAVGNVGAGTDDLITYAVPANVLSATGKTLRIKAWGTTANNSNAKTVTFVVGSQTVLTTALTVSIAGQWEVECYVTRTGSSTQDIRARLIQGATLIFDQEFTAGTQTDSGAITVKCTGAATSNNDIVQEGMVTEIIN